MKDYELSEKIEQIDNIVEELVSNTITPNFEQTRDRWVSSVASRSAKTIKQLDVIREELRQIIASKES